MNTRVLAFSFLILFALILAACGGESSTGGPSDESVMVSLPADSKPDVCLGAPEPQPLNGKSFKPFEIVGYWQAAKESEAVWNPTGGAGPNGRALQFQTETGTIYKVQADSEGAVYWRANGTTYLRISGDSTGWVEKNHGAFCKPKKH